MLKETKHYETEYGVGSQWTINGNSFFTLEFFDSGYIDFYEHEISWLEALKNGENNENRMGSIPNVFQDDEAIDTFYIFAAIFGGSGNVKEAINILVGVFNMCEDGYIYPKNWTTVCQVEQLKTENNWIEI